MNKVPNFQFKSNSDSDRSRRELLEQTKLSRLPQRNSFKLPELPQQQPFTFDNAATPNTAAVVVTVCAGCGGRLDRDDNFQQSIHGCRKCIGIYTRIDLAIEESAKRKKRELLEKFIGGAE
jgi:hypothetical protein